MPKLFNFLFASGDLGYIAAMAKPPPIVLTIAGFDPSSGAGVTADIKTIAAHECYGVACIAAMTVQSTLGVRRIWPVAPNIVTEILEELARDMSFAAVHIGMLGSADAATAVADFLALNRPPNIVLDPIAKSTSGAVLLDPEGLAVLAERVIPLSSVITPNIYEASVISGLRVETRPQMSLAAAKLHLMGAKAVVITGGHLDEPADLLSSIGDHGTEQQFFEARHIESNSTHGTGCAFSTAIACHLAFGRRLTDAVGRAQRYVSSAIAEAYPVGAGFGPVNHFYALRRINNGEEEK